MKYLISLVLLGSSVSYANNLPSVTCNVTEMTNCGPNNPCTGFKKEAFAADDPSTHFALTDIKGYSIHVIHIRDDLGQLEWQLYVVNPNKGNDSIAVSGGKYIQLYHVFNATTMVNAICKLN